MLVKWSTCIYTMIRSTHKSYVYLTILKTLVVTESTVNHNQRQTRYLEYPNFHWINRIENFINNFSLLTAKPGISTLVIDYTWTEGTNLGTHSCTGSIGNPPGTMTLEIRDGETGNYTGFIYLPNHSPTIKCSNNFNTENIRSHNIRCVANNQHTLSISESPFYSREVFVSPLPGKPILLNLLT